MTKKNSPDSSRNRVRYESPIVPTLPKKGKSPGSELRDRAEKKLKPLPADIHELSKKEIKELIHELRTHQIELEMQNEDLRAAQEELTASQRRYSDFYDFAPVGFFTFDKNGLILEVNLPGALLLNVDRQSLIKKPFHLFVHNEDRRIFRAYLGDVFMNKGTRSCEIRLKIKRGTIYTQLQSIAVEDSHEAVSCKTVINDITERRLTDNSLRESRYFAQRIADATPDILYIFDVIEHDLIYANEALGRALGYTLEDIRKLGDSLYRELIHPEDLEKVDEARKSILSMNKDDVSELDFRMKHANGEWRWLSSRSVLFSGTEGGLVKQVLGTARDITSQKEAEKERERLVENLERSNEDLEQFAYVASHDLREPLRMVSSYLQLIERRYKGRLDKDADEFIDFAVKGADYMQVLLGELLRFSRLGREAGSFELTDLNEVCRRASVNLKSAVEENQAQIICGKLPSVYAHTTQMVQVFQNLIGNAIKFRGKEKPVVRISAERLTDGWAFEFCDNGLGIAPEYFDRIFLMFKRLHVRDKYPGTGVGLAICRKIVELHGGRMWVVSEPGVGSTFYFTIPDKR